MVYVQINPHPCSHTLENYDDFSGFCWCDPLSCQPSQYIPKSCDENFCEYPKEKERGEIPDHPNR